VDLGIIRFQADGFVVLSDRLVDLAFLVEHHAEVVVGVSVTRFQAEGFLELAARPRYIVTPRSRFAGCARFNVSRNALGTA
jgi:hypothetical protein